MDYSIPLPNESESLRVGAALARQFIDSRQRQLVVTLSGTLGAGKTTFTRGVLQGAGHTGAVKSPTYTLVEPYELAQINAYHFDLYRLGDPEELEFMGVRDYFDAPGADEKPMLCLIEWPQRGGPLLPKSDLALNFTIAGEGRVLEICRPSAKSWQQWCCAMQEKRT